MLAVVRLLTMPRYSHVPPIQGTEAVADTAAADAIAAARHGSNTGNPAVSCKYYKFADDIQIIQFRIAIIWYHCIFQMTMIPSNYIGRGSIDMDAALLERGYGYIMNLEIHWIKSGFIDWNSGSNNCGVIEWNDGSIQLGDRPLFRIDGGLIELNSGFIEYVDSSVELCDESLRGEPIELCGESIVM